MKSRIRLLLAICLAICVCFFAASCGADDHVEEDEASEEQELELETDISGYIGGFSASDLDGNEVTGDIFAQNDVTIVNIWGTFCPPCIEELPDLQDINESLPENVQMIGVLCDVISMEGDEYDEAIRLVDENGLTYRNLIYDKSMSFMEKVMYVPTTLLVDSEGNVIGEPIIGSDVEAYKEALSEALDD